MALAEAELSKAKAFHQAAATKVDMLRDSEVMLDKALSILSEDHYKVVQLLIEGRTQKEVAQTMHYTDRNIRKIVARLNDLID